MNIADHPELIISQPEFQRADDAASVAFYNNSRLHGFWEDIRGIEEILEQHAPSALLTRFRAMVIAEKIALIHSELSEALEAVRTGIHMPDHHVPEYTNFEVELADARIRLGDLVVGLSLRHAEVVVAKHNFNVTRPKKHNKQS